MKGFVYILKDSDYKFYIGSTNNMARRLAHHKYGGTHTTRKMKNPEPVLVQECKELKEARKIELKLKKLKRRDFIEKIIKDGYIKIK